MRWEPALNAFAITFGGRITPTGNNQCQARSTGYLTVPAKTAYDMR